MPAAPATLLLCTDLTTTFSSALKLGDADSLEALLTMGKSEGRDRLSQQSDSFNRRIEGIMGIGSGELQLPQGGVDAMLDTPAFMPPELGGVGPSTMAAAAGLQGSQHKGGLVRPNP